ncbi:hypothetical protein [Dietzia sp. CH92]|uniref:WXG100 family type VII secretion target n=1 Tax=Dietzia sp. CH92 TaxID=3051823 RepID=UPI0028D40D3C|nr:hypothetical protein [Dietzia sp. CH92]
MSMLFAAAGGLIEAQDEELAGALSKAAEEPAGLQSLGLIHASGSEGFILEDACVMGGYGRVGPEDVSDSPLDRIASCAQALQPDQFDEISARATTVSEVLESAATQLQADLDNVLGSGWQGEFAASAQDSVRGLVTSAVALSGELGRVAAKAQRAQEGFAVTRTNIAEQAMQAKAAELSGRELGPAGLPAAARAQAQRQAAEEQARAIVNTEYSPAVMDANLDDLDFTSAYRVVATSALGGPGGIYLARIWNTDGVVRPARPATPDPAALAAAAGAGAGAAGAGVDGGGQPGPGATAAEVGQPVAPTDAATEQALLAARAAAAEGGASGAATGNAGAGAGVNATTTAAAAPMAPVTGTAGQPAGGAGAGGIRGLRGGTENRGRDRGFGSTAGLVGGGGAAAAGAGASRMGGAGTLAGYAAGGPAGPGAGGPTAGVPGAGSAPGGTAGTGPGTMGSSSSTSTANGPRAGAMPMGAMMGAAGAGQNSDRRGHTPAGYLTNATNTTAIIGDPVKVAPAVLGRTVDEPAQSGGENGAAPYRGRTLGRDYTGGGAKGP